MADLATLQRWLSEAEAARHHLHTGARTVSLSYAGRSVSYAQADADKLDQYIARLQDQISAAQTGSTPRRRLFRVMQTGNGLG